MTATLAPAVLVFPRAVFGSAYSLLPWGRIRPHVDEIERSFSWLTRPEAEQAEDVVQAIPCAVVRDSSNRYCVFRRVRGDRRDLSGRLSLIVGGHIDDVYSGGGFVAAMSSNLLREIYEEIGVLPEKNPRPLGVIIDGSSIGASRHVAFLHEIVADEVSPGAPEEFSGRSKFTGEFMKVSELGRRRDEFDPWSRLVIEEYLCPGGVRPAPRQSSFV